jgi:hypothetical protein
MLRPLVLDEKVHSKRGQILADLFGHMLQIAQDNTSPVGSPRGAHVGCYGSEYRPRQEESVVEAENTFERLIRREAN